MVVVSVSLEDETFEELDALVKRGGYKGRSDTVRQAIKLLSIDQKIQSGIEGDIAGVLVIVHDERYEGAFSKAKHEFEQVIKTQIHNQLGKGKCLELFLFNGPSEIIKQLVLSCRNSGKADYIKIIVP